MSRQTQRTTVYLSYLLRLWQEVRDDKPVWRASLESAQTGQQMGFASLHELLLFLEDRIEVSSADKEVTSCESTSTPDTQEI